jgi:hypothetical protein
MPGQYMGNADQNDRDPSPHDSQNEETPVMLNLFFG